MSIYHLHLNPPTTMLLQTLVDSSTGYVADSKSPPPPNAPEVVAVTGWGPSQWLCALEV